jgi:transcription antitermination factor NusG
MSNTWHIWVIKSGKFKYVKKYIEDEVKEVVEVMYPQVRKERVYKNTIKIKDEPQYMNYLFVRHADEDFDTVVNKFERYPFITTHVGVCTGADLGLVEKMKEVNDRRIKAPYFVKGEKIKIVGGPFSDFKGKVQETKATEVLVEIEMFNRTTVIAVPREQIDFDV